jgi:hypothetical protein
MYTGRYSGPPTRKLKAKASSGLGCLSIFIVSGFCFIMTIIMLG